MNFEIAKAVEDELLPYHLEYFLGIREPSDGDGDDDYQGLDDEDDDDLDEEEDEPKAKKVRFYTRKSMFNLGIRAKLSQRRKMKKVPKKAAKEVNRNKNVSSNKFLDSSEFVRYKL